MSTPAQLKNRRYQRNYRASLVGRFCDCGAPAVGIDGTGWFCAECRRLNDLYCGTAPGAQSEAMLVFHGRARQAEPIKSRTEKLWEDWFCGWWKEDGAGWGSLAVLEERLARIGNA